MMPKVAANTKKTYKYKKLTLSVLIFKLVELFFKTSYVFKNKSVRFDKGSSNTGITKYFLI